MTEGSTNAGGRHDSANTGPGGTSGGGMSGGNTGAGGAGGAGASRGYGGRRRRERRQCAASQAREGLGMKSLSADLDRVLRGGCVSPAAGRVRAVLPRRRRPRHRSVVRRLVTPRGRGRGWPRASRRPPAPLRVVPRVGHRHPGCGPTRPCALHAGPGRPNMSWRRVAARTAFQAPGRSFVWS